MSAADDFVALRRAIGTVEDEDAVREAFERRLDELGYEDHTPVLGDLARDLTARRLVAPRPVPAEHMGWGWTFALLADLLPGVVTSHEGDVARMDVPALDVSARLVHGDGVERYSVVSLSADPYVDPEEPQGPIILDTFSPTDEQIRRWAFDPNLRFTVQDERVAIEHVSLLPLLLELANDPTCPKRHRVHGVADDLLVSPVRGPFRRDLLREAIAAASPSAVPEMRAWAGSLAEVLAYIDEVGPVSERRAHEIGATIALGCFRSSCRLEVSQLRDWAVLTTVHDAGVIDHLYVCTTTGALAWSRTPLDAEVLAPLAAASPRDASLAWRPTPADQR